MSCYPPETMRALDRQAEAWDHAERMQAMHVSTISRIARGVWRTEVLL